MDIEIGAKLGQMSVQIGIDGLLQDAVRPVRSCQRKPRKALPEHAVDIGNIAAHHGFDLGLEPFHLKLDLDLLHTIRPWYEIDIDACVVPRLYSDTFNGVADKHFVEHLADRSFILQSPCLVRGERLACDKLRRDGRDAFFHARLDERRHRAAIGHDFSRNLVNRPCSRCGKRCSPCKNKGQNSHEPLGRKAPEIHQNEPPTLKWTRPPSLPRP